MAYNHCLIIGEFKMMNLENEITVLPYSGESYVSLFMADASPYATDFRTAVKRGELNQSVDIFDDDDSVKVISANNFRINANHDITLERCVVDHVKDIIGIYIPEELGEHFRYILYSKINWCIDKSLTYGETQAVALTISNKFVDVAFLIRNPRYPDILDFELFLFPIKSELYSNVFNAIKGN